MKTTLNAILLHSPCGDGWRRLLKNLGKTVSDDDPLPILTVLKSNGLDDALWALRAVEGCDREIRLLAVWCARQVQHLMTDQRSLEAMDVAERFANGNSDDDELSAAGTSAWAAAEAAAEAAAGAAEDAAEDAAARAAAWAAAQAAQKTKLIEICEACRWTIDYLDRATSRRGECVLDTPMTPGRRLRKTSGTSASTTTCSTTTWTCTKTRKAMIPWKPKIWRVKGVWFCSYYRNHAAAAGVDTFQ